MEFTPQALHRSTAVLIIEQAKAILATIPSNWYREDENINSDQSKSYYSLRFFGRRGFVHLDVYANVIKVTEYSCPSSTVAEHSAFTIDTKNPDKEFIWDALTKFMKCVESADKPRKETV